MTGILLPLKGQWSELSPSKLRCHHTKSLVSNPREAGVTLTW